MIFRTTILLFIVAGSLLAAQADTPKNVRNLMAPDDFSAAGLEKLSDEELARLSEWVERYRSGAVTGPPPVPKKPSQMTESEKVVYREEKEEQKNFELVAKVVPSFKGWSGKTVFHLDNGQVWQQRQSNNMRYSGNDATIIITTNVMGRYVMKHVDSGRSVGVKRIR